MGWLVDEAFGQAAKFFYASVAQEGPPASDVF